jgi:hypothetical protein
VHRHHRHVSLPSAASSPAGALLRRYLVCFDTGREVEHSPCTPRDPTGVYVPVAAAVAQALGHRIKSRPRLWRLHRILQLRRHDDSRLAEGLHAPAELSSAAAHECVACVHEQDNGGTAALHVGKQRVGVDAMASPVAQRCAAGLDDLQRHVRALS